ADATGGGLTGSRIHSYPAGVTKEVLCNPVNPGLVKEGLPAFDRRRNCGNASLHQLNRVIVCQVSE
ncbi:MAG TPA: hypothetical protein VNP95_03810, partial [Thermomicrobiales bacterium]|nr:hypothetical protein [Thermomicrobiales bacterium]